MNKYNLKSGLLFATIMALAGFLTISGATQVFAVSIVSPRPAQSLGLSVGNLPSNGSPNAKVKIIEYGNYYDSFSRRFFQNTEQQLRAEYIETGKVVMYWKDFVFPDYLGLLGDTSAANAARCANEQGMFWQYHDLLLAPQIDPYSGPAGQEGQLNFDFKSFGEQLGLDMTRFDRCFDTERHLPLVDVSSQNAVREGIVAVPTFFINGRPIIGAQPFDEFKRIIEEELAK